MTNRSLATANAFELVALCDALEQPGKHLYYIALHASGYPAVVPAPEAELWQADITRKAQADLLLRRFVPVADSLPTVSQPIEQLRRVCTQATPRAVLAQWGWPVMDKPTHQQTVEAILPPADVLAAMFTAYAAWRPRHRVGVEPHFACQALTTFIHERVHRNQLFFDTVPKPS